MGAHRPALAGLLAAVALAAGPVAAASGQEPAVRLAAPEDCLVNPGCGEGLRATYALDVAPAFTPLAVADAGIGALDDGVAEVAVAFSTDPQVSRPDIVTLRDDRRMLGPDRLVPVLRRGMLRALGTRRARRLTRRINATGRLLTTLQLRSLNQQVADGRLPEAVGGGSSRRTARRAAAPERSADQLGSSPSPNESSRICSPPRCGPPAGASGSSTSTACGPRRSSRSAPAASTAGSATRARSRASSTPTSTRPGPCSASCAARCAARPAPPRRAHAGREPNSS